MDDPASTFEDLLRDLQRRITRLERRLSPEAFGVVHVPPGAAVLVAGSVAPEGWEIVAGLSAPAGWVYVAKTT